MVYIRDLARRLRKDYRTRDPFVICDQVGVFVLTADLPEITKGFYFAVKGKPIINLNRSLPESERMVVCAHELGHVLLHATCNVSFLSTSTNFVISRYEREANYFSACLLLDELVDSTMDCTIEQLSQETGVPMPLVLLWAETEKKADMQHGKIH